MAITDTFRTDTSTLARPARPTQQASPAQATQPASPANTGSSNGNASHVDSFVPSGDRHVGAELTGANLAKSVFAAWGPSSAAGGSVKPSANQAAGGAEFKYDGVPHIVHTSSIGWKPGSPGMSPTQANQSITEGYKELNSNMVRYLSGDPNGPKLPALADWTAFGKFASREAGEQIRNLEDVSKFQTNGDPDAARRLAENMTGSEALKQGVGMGLNHGGNVAGAAVSGDPVGVATQISKAVDTPDAMLGALTKGNNGIYDNFAPAYDAFLKGEADGGKGMEALGKAGYTPGSAKDPQGFFNKALGGYKEARELGLQAQQEKDPAKRQALLDKREKLVGESNLDLGNQEQMHIIQRKDIFGDPKVSENIKSLGGTMAMHDANGTHKLLPNGGGGFRSFSGLLAATPLGSLSLRGLPPRCLRTGRRGHRSLCGEAPLAEAEDGHCLRVVSRALPGGHQDGEWTVAAEKLRGQPSASTSRRERFPHRLPLQF